MFNAHWGLYAIFFTTLTSVVGIFLLRLSWVKDEILFLETRLRMYRSGVLNDKVDPIPKMCVVFFNREKEIILIAKHTDDVLNNKFIYDHLANYIKHLYVPRLPDPVVLTNDRKRQTIMLLQTGGVTSVETDIYTYQTQFIMNSGEPYTIKKHVID